MPALNQPFPQFFDLDGTPLDNGFIYIGSSNMNPETSPVQCYWDYSLTQPAPQPFRTSNGYIMRNGSPAQVFTGIAFSLTVKNKNGALIIYQASSQGADTAGGVIFQNPYTISADVTIDPLKNGMSAGPITILDGVTVTIPTTSSWHIVGATS